MFDNQAIGTVFNSTYARKAEIILEQPKYGKCMWVKSFQTE